MKECNACRSPLPTAREIRVIRESQAHIWPAIMNMAIMSLHCYGIDGDLIASACDSWLSVLEVIDSGDGDDRQKIEAVAGQYRKLQDAARDIDRAPDSCSFAGETVSLLCSAIGVMSSAGLSSMVKPHVNGVLSVVSAADESGPPQALLTPFPGGAPA